MENPITKFLSSISLEIYLSHMVIYRVIEKTGLNHLFASDILSYIVTSIGTIAGTIVFSVVAKKGLSIFDRLRRQIKNI